MTQSHDHPSARAHPRLYVAIIGACNRACPWCSVRSSPAKTTRMEPEELAGHFPGAGPFELQLEGGEPTVHQRIFEFVRIARAEPRMRLLVLSTNGVAIPRAHDALRRWLDALGRPALIKLSINHHLLEQDDGLLGLARSLRGEAAPGVLELVGSIQTPLARAGVLYLTADPPRCPWMSFAPAGTLQRDCFARKQCEQQEKTRWTSRSRFSKRSATR